MDYEKTVINRRKSGENYEKTVIQRGGHAIRGPLTAPAPIDRRSARLAARSWFLALPCADCSVTVG